MGTTEKRWSSFPLNLNYISLPFHILGRNAQYYWKVNESFSVESCSLKDEVRYIRPIFPFFNSPFSSKGKRRKRGWRIEADDWHTRPVFSSFTANSLNRIMRIWVRLKRHHRRNRAKTILFFHSYDRKCTVVKSRQNPASSYIQLSSLVMFSSQIAQNAVLMNVNGEIAIWSLIYLTEPLSLDITHKFASLSHLGNNFIIKLEILYCLSMTYEDIVRFGRNRQVHSIRR